MGLMMIGDNGGLREEDLYDGAQDMQVDEPQDNRNNLPAFNGSPCVFSAGHNQVSTK